MILGEIKNEKVILERYENKKFTVDTLGKPTIDNPIKEAQFMDSTMRTLYITDNRVFQIFCKNGKMLPSFEVAGPRKKLYFDPPNTRCAIVTCGGLCPGLNDVIRAIIMELHYIYGVEKDVYGVRYGLQGFIPKYGYDFMMLDPQKVKGIHKEGGTILGSSRGPQSEEEIVDTLERNNINVLFMIGGDGTLRAAEDIYKLIQKRKLNISIIGIPKTIDNDIPFIQRSFGFETAFTIATDAITAAHNEAEGAPYGIGIVKLMGRHSGFITGYATLAQRDANYALVPELDFDLDGDRGLLKNLEKRLRDRKHAVIVVAEGAGQKFFDKDKLGTDPSGNQKLGDIGKLLKDEIKKYFSSTELEVSVKYIDPSYMLRGVPANMNDSAFAGILSQSAVHAAMCGKTGIVIGRWNSEFTYVPLHMVNTHKKTLSDININFWYNVIEATGQPTILTNS